MERIKQQEYYKFYIRKLFEYVGQESKSPKDTVKKEEISYIMRFLNQFPSEAQVIDYIIPKLEDDEPSDFIKLSKFEPFMLEVLAKNEFEPSPAEHLLAAFRVLDTEGNGKIPFDLLKNLLCTEGIPFREQEILGFESYALDKSQKLVFYEDYVAKLMEENDQHI
eukprot:CAMPEP_0168341232 /NCGR_PEP_ID=MMETSP0213-20121227/14549_1 /TAXON_ID=151035 /ORGANISM="Euplotes harpa, Strain FSP1.4" /LENGTH=164 /DNA_ID=CAMNT_0008347645 /DNA_START=53 /DNA_END=547 /DNA_ORIENTATION=+